MKIRNDFTASIKSPGRYCPNEFTAVSAMLFAISLIFVMRGAERFVAAVFGGYLRELATKDILLVYILGILLSQGVIAVSAAVFSAVMKVNPISGGGYRFSLDLTPMLFGCALVMGAALCLTPLHAEFSDAAGDIFGGLYVSSAGISEEYFSRENIFWEFPLIILSSTLLPCIIEEAAFRGIMMRGLNRFGGFASVVISSALFALFHGNFSQLILQFVCGLLIGACVYITGNFALGCAMHFFNNLTAYGIRITASLLIENSAYQSVFTFVSALAGLALLVVSANYFLRVYLRNRGLIENNPMYGRPLKPILVALSEEGRADRTYLIAEASEIKAFKKFYPRAMMYGNGGFESMRREGGVIPAAIITAIAVALSALSLVA